MVARMNRLWLQVQWALALVLAAGGAAAALDPTEPPKLRASAAAGGEAAPEEATLAWVRVNGRNSIAWYGGTTVRLGDAVEGGRVTAIHEDHIVISGKGGSRSVYLLDNSTRKQPQAPTRPAR
jgi:hypothetical protein